MKHNSITNAISKDSASKEEVTRAHENPIRHESFQPLSFSLKDVKATMIHEAGGSNKMNKKQQNIIEHLQRMDEDGDGTISLLEIIYMEKKFQKSKNQQKKLKFLVMSMFFVFILLMLSFFAMAVWAVEITKETRAAGGNTLSKPASSSDIPPMEQPNRRLRISILNSRNCIGQYGHYPPISRRLTENGDLWRTTSLTGHALQDLKKRMSKHTARMTFKVSSNKKRRKLAMHDLKKKYNLQRAQHELRSIKTPHLSLLGIKHSPHIQKKKFDYTNR